MLDRVTRRSLHLPESQLEIALLDWGGEGPLALLHHANGFCAALWDLVARELCADFHVVALDARGHGDSTRLPEAEAYQWELLAGDAIAVAEALAAEGAGRVALGVGHSIGGTTLLRAAARRPALFERLVLVDPVMTPPQPMPERAAHVAELVESARKRSAVWPSRDEARRRWSGKPFFQGWQPEAFEIYLRFGLRDRPDGQVELKCHPEVEAALFAGNAGYALWEQPPLVHSPALFLWATHGDFPRPFYERFAAGMPDARIHDVESGHLVPMQRPERVVEECRAFAAA